MRIVVAEDSQADMQQVDLFLRRYFSSAPSSTSASSRIARGPVEIVPFEDGRSLIDYLSEKGARGIDAFLLDIEMPGADGLKVARFVRTVAGDTPICFVTNLGYLALEGYEVDAIGFLVKPLSYSSFRTTMDRLTRRIEGRRRELVEFKDGKLERFVDVGRIFLIESRDKKTYVSFVNEAGGAGGAGGVGTPAGLGGTVGSDGAGETGRTGGVETVTFAVRESLSAIEARLGRPEFYRVHSGFLVNLRYVDTVGATDAVVFGKTVPISKHRRKGFMQALTRFIGRGLI